MSDRFKEGDRVFTIADTGPKNYTEGARDSNLWGVEGVVVRVSSDSHGLSYMVEHGDVAGWYEPSELRWVSMSMLNIIDVWTAHSTIDDHDALGEMLGVYSSEALAAAAAEGKGWYNSNGKVFRRKAVSTPTGNGNLFYLLENGIGCLLGDAEILETVRKKALAKLTPEERKALGLP